MPRGLCFFLLHAPCRPTQGGSGGLLPSSGFSISFSDVTILGCGGARSALHVQFQVLPRVSSSGKWRHSLSVSKLTAVAVVHMVLVSLCKCPHYMMLNIDMGKLARIPTHTCIEHSKQSCHITCTVLTTSSLFEQPQRHTHTTVATSSSTDRRKTQTYNRKVTSGHT